ncbi:MAG: methyltransferase [Candidatus Nanopelagicales bacterium]|jgi:tRNA/tmRNA/rRNA uracil-C5-methylase (TrmA/RlmC/RlmD family)|nr:methyltransferase [Candidatus Nanopelagicales bacterium]MCU0299504.1 methyltransferase [Candidatus Nanopelagicales bacterium]
MPDLRLEVGKPAHGGTCVARHEGRVVFTGYSLPGETVRAAFVEGGEDARFWRAEALEVLSAPSRDRVDTPCPWFGPGMCGGCSWLQATPAAQLAIKAEVLTDVLERIGGLHIAVPVRSIGPDSGWRIRATLHVDEQGRAGMHALRSHAVVSIGDCRQADTRMGLVELLSRSWPASAEVHVSVSDAGRAVIVRGPAGVERTGPTEHRHTVLGRTFSVAPDGFWQSHRDGASVLAQQVVTLAGEGTSVIDLYAGVGLFGLALLDAGFEQVQLVEGQRRAAAFARRNARTDRGVRIVARDVRDWARGPGGSADVVVMDPPRAGAGAKVVRAIGEVGAATVVYVSCEPSTLARDLRTFDEIGYHPDHIEGFDLFPGTAHVETVVRLRR